MAQADSKNSTAAHATPTRRRFLSQAAGVAAGGAALAAAAPANTLDPANASPALRIAVRALDEAHECLKGANAAVEAGWEKLHALCSANPRPTERRAQKKWNRRHREYRESVVQDALEDRRVSEDNFRAAQMAVAKIEARNMGELALKACISGVYDKVHLGGGQSAVIGYSVALNLISLTAAGTA